MPKHSSEQTAKKFHIVKSYLGRHITDSNKRPTEVALETLQIRHAHVTHSHLLTGSPRPMCSGCGKALAVIHILIQFKALDITWRKLFPQLYTGHIPQHPSYFFGHGFMFSIKGVFEFRTGVKILNIISYYASEHPGPLHQSYSLRRVFICLFLLKCFTFTFMSLSWTDFCLALFALSWPCSNKILTSSSFSSDTSSNASEKLY